MSGHESKPKLKEAEQQPVTPKSKINAPQPQNSAPRPETEQLSKTAEKAAAPNMMRDQVKSPHADTFATALTSQNNAPLPEIEQAGKTAVSDTALNQAKSPRSGTSATTPKSQNNAPVPEIEQAGKTAVADTAHNQAKSPRFGTSATTSKSQKSALTPKTELPLKTVAAIMSTDFTYSRQDNVLEITGNSTMPVSPDKSTTLLVTESGYALSCHENAADKQCWATHFQRNQTIERALRGLPEPLRLENAAASAFKNQEPTEW